MPSRIKISGREPVTFYLFVMIRYKESVFDIAFFFIGVVVYERIAKQSEQQRARCAIFVAEIVQRVVIGQPDPVKRLVQSNLIEIKLFRRLECVYKSLDAMIAFGFRFTRGIDGKLIENHLVHITPISGVDYSIHQENQWGRRSIPHVHPP